MFSVNTFAEKLEENFANAIDNSLAQPELVCEDPDGTGHMFQITLNNYIPEDPAGEVLFAVWSEENGQDDLLWYSASSQANGSFTYLLKTADHEYDTGVYNIHAYQEDIYGVMHGILASSYIVSEISMPEPVVEVISSQNDREYTVQVSNCILLRDESLMVAVWSEEKGQDDLRWSKLTPMSDGTFQYICQVSDHGSIGDYYANVYLQHADGTMEGLKSCTFNVNGSSIADVSIKNLDNVRGTCEIVVDGVENLSGIEKVQVPVWSMPDQSDLVWYNAEAIGNGQYRVKMDISNHRYHIGTYQFHVYITGGNGICQNLWQSTVEFTASSASVATTKQTGGYLLKANNVMLPGGVSQVLFAVWSEAGGQDDLVWNYAQYQEEKHAAEYRIFLKNYKGYGKYQVHCYAKGFSEELVFIGSTEFWVDAPTVEDVDISVNNVSGFFTVTISGVESSAGIESVMVPVWCAEDQSDLIWYTATEAEKGTYTVMSDISRHAFHVGNYKADVYLNDKNGLSLNAGRVKFDFHTEIESTDLQKDENETVYPLKIKGVEIPGGEDAILAAVWSAAGGQDDLAWYTAQKEGMNYKVNIDIRNHKSAGDYFIHIYARTKNGDMIFLDKNDTLHISGQVTAEIRISDRNDKEGSFLITVRIEDALSGISKIQVPVWNAADQSDIVWYEAQRQNENTFTVKAEVKNHRYHLGMYQIHAYATLGNGIFAGAGCSSYEFNPNNFMYILKDQEEGKRSVYLKNATGGNVQFAVWSETGGQDDLIWYSGSQLDETTWGISFDCSNHKDAGKYFVHAYSDSMGLVTGETYVADDEILRTMIWPCPSSHYISSGYGNRNAPTAGATTNHKGIDIAASAGSTILSAQEGTVTGVGYSSSRGNYVIITHGRSGVQTEYLHMSRYIVSMGQKISAGQTIGYVGSTGISTGPHLHFAVKENGNYTDPMPYLEGRKLIKI